MIFKAIVVGLLALQLIKLFRRRPAPTAPTYIIATAAEKPIEKIAVIDQQLQRSSAPPPDYYAVIGQAKY